MTSPCTDRQEQLVLWKYGELANLEGAPATELAELIDHVETCETCAGFAASVAEVKAFLDSDSEIDIPEELAGIRVTVMAAIQEADIPGDIATLLNLDSDVPPLSKDDRIALRGRVRAEIDRRKRRVISLTWLTPLRSAAMFFLVLTLGISISVGLLGDASIEEADVVLFENGDIEEALALYQDILENGSGAGVERAKRMVRMLGDPSNMVDNFQPVRLFLQATHDDHREDRRNRLSTIMGHYPDSERARAAQGEYHVFNPPGPTRDLRNFRRDMISYHDGGQNRQLAMKLLNKATHPGAKAYGAYMLARWEEESGNDKEARDNYKIVLTLAPELPVAEIAVERLKRLSH